jgi:hypothetical protein
MFALYVYTMLYTIFRQRTNTDKEALYERKWN